MAFEPNNTDVLSGEIYGDYSFEASSSLLGINLGPILSTPAKTLVDLLGSSGSTGSYIFSNGKVLEKTSTGSLIDLGLTVGTGTGSTAPLVNVDGNIFGRGTDGKLVDLNLDIGAGGIITSGPGTGGTGTGSSGSGVNPDATNVYRFFNTDTGVHFYTATGSERDNIVATMPRLKYEGAGFQASTNTSDGPEIFRFYNTTTKTHFFTASATERDAVISKAGSYKYEGVAYTAYSDDGGGKHEALFRFFNTDTGTHFYTASTAEVQQVKAIMPQMTYEGVAYYVDAM